MSNTPATCPECYTPVGAGTPIDSYQHAVACMHVPDRGIESVKEWVKRHENPEYSKRVLKLLGIGN